jgi:alcohol dehydrogenase YqhD (iron-dependent ADH family)
MQAFQYKGMPRVYFGEGAFAAAWKAEEPSIGRKVMLTYGGGSIKRSGIYEEVLKTLTAGGREVVEFSGIMSNPTYAKVQEGAELARQAQVDFILAVGGGSVIDASKIISAQACMEGDIWDQEFHQGRMPSRFIPMAAVVTASGTGAEMNNGAVITNEQTHQKKGMGGALADFAVLDPSYTLSVPKMQAVSGAFDTLSHCMETYFGKPSETNVSDEINEAVMRNVIRNLRAMLKDPQDRAVRSELMWDSSMAENGLLKLGKITDFQAHQLEHQLGAYTNCSHGQGLAVLHPALYRHLYKDNLEKFDRFATAVWGLDPADRSKEELALAGIDALAAFIAEIGLPVNLRQLRDNMPEGSPDPTDKELLRRVADSTSTTRGCARALDGEEFYAILLESL